MSAVSSCAVDGRRTTRDSAVTRRCVTWESTGRLLVCAFLLSHLTPQVLLPHRAPSRSRVHTLRTAGSLTPRGSLLVGNNPHGFHARSRSQLRSVGK
jgi:hypothetical protein